LQRFADSALYRAKEAGRNQVALFDRVMQSRMEAALDRGSALRMALRSGLIVPWYQPEIDLRTREFVGAEALARWIRPEGVMTAGEFMPVAREVGLELPISDRIVLDVVNQRAQWHHVGMDPTFRVRVNVTAQQSSSPEHLRALIHELTLTEAPAQGICVEVTETDVIRDLDLACAMLDEVRSHGISVALDDFGTGHSSLSLLQRLPLDAVKIDRSFIRDIYDDRRDRALVRTVIGLADELGLSVTAEGVETEVQEDILLNMGCRYAQGFLYSRAVPVNELETMLAAGTVQTNTEFQESLVR
jgi:EAL domain-containing protein (putative c-di-GMP-specific phosphodiesterase class I)